MEICIYREKAESSKKKEEEDGWETEVKCHVNVETQRAAGDKKMRARCDNTYVPNSASGVKGVEKKTFINKRIEGLY